MIPWSDFFFKALRGAWCIFELQRLTKDWNRIWGNILAKHEADINQMKNKKAKNFISSLSITKAFFTSEQKEDGETFYGEPYSSSCDSHILEIMCFGEKWIIDSYSFMDSYDFFSGFTIKDKLNKTHDIYAYFCFKKTNDYAIFWACFCELFEEIDAEYSCIREWEIAQNKKTLHRYNRTKRK